jgi:L-cystine uptake protein TcyP (sodium:dicarboxylate symporter family)
MAVLVFSFYLLLLSIKYKSINTNATIDSTIGATLGKIHGSCLHFIWKSTAFQYLSTVFWGLYILEVGFTAILKIISSQVVIPHKIQE